MKNQPYLIGDPEAGCGPWSCRRACTKSTIGKKDLVLKCPWHQWEFDLATGQALYDETMRVKTYAAGREGEEVVVYVE